MIVSPVRGYFSISQGYGKNSSIYSSLGRKFNVPLQSHNGQDIALPTGVSIYAPIDGTVDVGFEPNGYGHYIRIIGLSYNSAGDFREVILAHLSYTAVVSGTEVKAGDEIGKSGNTGFSTGPHLHWGMRRRNKEGVIYNYGKNCGYENIFEKGWILSNEVSKY